MSTEFCKDIPLSVLGRAGKMFVALRFSSGECFTFERLLRLWTKTFECCPVHSSLEGCVVSDVLFARRGWGEWCVWDFLSVSVAFW